MAEMPLNAQRRYTVRGGGDEDTVGVLSTEDVFDLFGGEIGRMGIETFRRTGAILWGHDGDMLPIGRATWIEFDADERWTVGWKWAENDFAKEVRREWEAGILTAMSVGMSVAFGDDFEVEAAELREASVVSVGADPGAYVASWTGPDHVMERVRAELGRDLHTASAPHILKLAASLRPATAADKEDDEMPKAEEEKQDAQPPFEKDEEEAQEDETKDATVPDPETLPKLAQEDEEERDAEEDEEREGAEDDSDKVEAAHRAQVIAHARELVPKGFRMAQASTAGIMRAALSWERKDADELGPVELAEAFADMVKRRSSALDSLLEAGTTSEKAAAAWKKANDAQSVPPGTAQGVTHPGHQKMAAELSNRWKAGFNNRKEA